MNPTGVTFLDHTADVGIDVTAPSLEALFHRAAVGMLALLRGADDEDEPHDAPSPPSGRATDGNGEVETLVVELDADDVVGLLADWLRELLFLHEARHADYVQATFDPLTEDALRARVETEPARPAVREIKGVTYHELGAERTEDGWHGRVIFDV